MYKKYTAENKALRLGLDAGFYMTEFKDHAASGNYGDNSNIQISFSVGKEFQQRLGEKWLWYYGGDVVPSFFDNKSETFADNEMTQSNKSWGYRLTLRPILGIRFNITNRLYLAAEASASLSYGISKTLEKRYNPSATMRDLTQSNASLSLNPASGIFIFYRF
jgi:hypothetical protein